MENNIDKKSENIGMKLTNNKNHIFEYFEKDNGSDTQRASKQLFTVDNDDIDLKTHVDNYEIVKISSMRTIDNILESRGLKIQFEKYVNPLLRLKISKDRLSRSEFVSINKQDSSESIVEGIKTAGGILGGR